MVLKIVFKRQAPLPVYRNQTIFEIVRGVKAFLKLDVGLVRGEIPDQEADVQRIRWELEQTRKQIAGKNRQLARLQGKPETSDGEAGSQNPIRPDNIVWIFGYGRSGSTWLGDMLADADNHTLWREPMLGMLFGDFYYNLSHHNIQFRDHYHNSRGFIFGRRRKSWLKLIRSFVLDGASETFPDVGNEGLLVVKEPNGSVGAPLLMEALPESRMVLLVRDPRDVLASILDAFGKDGWGLRVVRKEDAPVLSPETVAEEYVQHLGNAKLAYDAHQGRKVLIKYEDLRLDTLGVMQRAYSALGIDVDQRELARVVEKHTWENIPADSKGEGKFYRKAAPGGWREELTPDQVEIVERVTAPLLKEFYS